MSLKIARIDRLVPKRVIWIGGSVFIAALTFLISLTSLHAQSRMNLVDYTHDPRGVPEITVCTQNLGNFGRLQDVLKRLKGSTRETLDTKRNAIIKRILDVGCDVVAFQEVLGSSAKVAKKAMTTIVDQIRYRTNMIYDVYIGPSNDKLLQLGFLINTHKVSFSGYTSYVDVELPKIAERQKPREFSRGPFELRLRVNGRDGSPSRDLTLLNFHFKSRAFNSKDGADLEWETYRMEMAEAVRRIVLARHKESVLGDGSLLVVLGDRNSHFDTASAKLLTGEVVLQRFQGEAPCRLSKRGKPLCQAGATFPPIFTSVLTTDPQTKLTLGTYMYEKTFSWLDDILIPTTQLPFAFKQSGVEGDYDVGTVSEPKEASDHAMAYVRLNW